MGRAETSEEIDNALSRLSLLLDTIEKVFIGKRNRVEQALVALLSNGHLLIEDVPGVGKTILARTISKAVNCRFSRIQFTPDMLPSDVIGVSIYDNKSGEFVFKRGAVFANILLADEVNRTTPRTQSCLLEAMSDFQVTVDGISNPLPKPFCVLATQNPFEFEGTYPLPESQLDRFMLRIQLGYPTREDEKTIILSQRQHHPIDDIEPVMDGSEILGLQELVKQVSMDDSLVNYIVLIVGATRKSDEIAMGGSPRAGLHLFRAAQALAAIKGRMFCTPDDVKQMAVPVLAHRIVCRARSMGGNNNVVAARIVHHLLDEIPVPL